MGVCKAGYDCILSYFNHVSDSPLTMLCLYSNGDPFCLFYDDLQNNPAWSRTDLVSGSAFSNSLPRRIQSVSPLLNYAHFNFTVFSWHFDLHFYCALFIFRLVLRVFRNCRKNFKKFSATSAIKTFGSALGRRNTRPFTFLTIICFFIHRDLTAWPVAEIIEQWRSLWW